MISRADLIAPLVVVGLLVGCTPSTPAEVGQELATVVEGVLTACVAPTPRLVVEAPDSELGWDGFDVAVLEQVADTLALPLRLEVVSYDLLVSGVALNDRRCDLGAGGIVMSAALELLLDVSTPYRDVDRLIVAPAAAGIVATMPSELSGVRIGYEQGGPAADAVSSLTTAELVPYPSRTDLVRAFTDGDVAALLVAAGAVSDVRASDASVEVVLRVETDQQTVLALAKGANEAVVTAIDEAIIEFLASVEHAELVTVWLES
ncbi:MAG: ABC-type amino acid transport substrate-binding protein [Myxococcota bacterium]